MIEYRGEKFSGYNEPKDASDGVHKKVVLAKVGDKIRLIRFGAKGYSSNYSPEARAQYRKLFTTILYHFLYLFAI